VKKHSFVILAYHESDDLEDCIKSILKQTVKSNVLIATSTPNDFILELASKYSLGVTINESESNKGNDYNFALNRVDSELVTIAHQDDLYDRNYTKEILKQYEKNMDATIIFTDNYEINNDKKIKKNKRLRKQRHYLIPLKYAIFNKKKYFKLRALRKNKFICTSSITFVKKNISKEVFPTNLIYDNDWQGLIDLAKNKTKFVYLDKKLVGYRMDNISFDPEKIEEDKDILKSMYPKWYFDKIIKKRFEKM
jgi:hypothetical protein